MITNVTSRTVSNRRFLHIQIFFVYITWYNWCNPPPPSHLTIGPPSGWSYPLSTTHGATHLCGSSEWRAVWFFFPPSFVARGRIVFKSVVDLARGEFQFFFYFYLPMLSSHRLRPPFIKHYSSLYLRYICTAIYFSISNQGNKKCTKLYIINR